MNAADCGTAVARQDHSRYQLVPELTRAVQECPGLQGSPLPETYLLNEAVSGLISYLDLRLTHHCAGFDPLPRRTIHDLNLFTKSEVKLAQRFVRAVRQDPRFCDDLAVVCSATALLRRLRANYREYVG